MSPWAGGFPAGSNQGNDLSMNLLGSLMNNASSGSGNMANLATSLVAQALQNKPGGMLIGGNHFGGQSSMGGGGSSFNVSGPRGGGYSDRGGANRDDYRVSIFLDFMSAFFFKFGLGFFFTFPFAM